MSNIQVGVIMGSDSDLSIMKETVEILEDMGVTYQCTIVSAHRTPERMYEYAQGAEERGLKVIVAGAGGAAHLPGMVAALTNLPVIGVPIKGKSLEGLDSLYSIVQMPAGVPVATVAINGGKNAGILAAQIIALTDKEVKAALKSYKKSLTDLVEEKAVELEAIGHSDYLIKMKNI